ncbi:MAG TPA: hypothetical protein VHH36_07135 [Candidatus Thermoplasmatota archaeon]|nr:hypothetical protein [Candidatus Thermoplasmatota archaeon]
MRTLSILFAVALVAAAVPAALASWRGPGTIEPDTPQDAEAVGVYNFDKNDVDPSESVRKVYFNAFSTSYLTGFNPNTGAAGGTHVTPAVVHIHAHLGIWKDCNNDGYVGDIESALMEYRAEVARQNICPVGLHNDGTWIFELVHLGPMTDGNYAPNVRNVTYAKVWADVGLPGATPGFSCPLNPPNGTTASTGGLLRYSGCSLGNAPAQGVNAVSQVADPDDDLGLRFQDPKNPQSGNSTLDRDFPTNLWGNPEGPQRGLLESDRGDPAFQAWDCSEESETIAAPEGTEEAWGTKVEDPSGEFGEVSVVDEDGTVRRAPAPGSANPTGSYAEAANNTERGALHRCDEPGFRSVAADEVDEHGSGNEEGLGPVEGQLQSEGQASVGKNQVGVTFTFVDGASWGNSNVCAMNCSVNYTHGRHVQDVFGQNAPTYFGARGLSERGSTASEGDPDTNVSQTTGGAAPRWTADVVITSEEFYAAPENGGQPTPHRYFTFYAFVNGTTQEGLRLTLPVGNGVYGSDSCDVIGEGAPASNGWACDPALWYKDQGQDTDSAKARPRVGDAFVFRDVDCYNGVTPCGVDVL